MTSLHGDTQHEGVESGAGRSTSAGLPPGRSALARLARQTLVRNLVLACVFAVILAFLSIAFDPFNDLRLASGAYYFAALAGLTVLTGLNGQISLGHGALMAVGAYTVALLTARAGWSLAPALAASAVFTAAVGVAVGAVAARLRGPYLAGATLALAVGLPALADRYPSFLGGANGLTVSPPQPPGALSDMPLERWQAWISCACALIVFVLLSNLIRSRVGRTFRAVRDNEVAAQLAGLNVARTQVLAFIVSAACAGLGGGLLVIVTAVAAPGAFELTLSLELLTGVVLGGLGSLAGALWGSIALVMLPSWTHDVAQSFSLSLNVGANLPLVLYGLILIGVIIAAPEGIQGALRRVYHLIEARVPFGGTNSFQARNPAKSKQEGEQ
jgi:branched-chain amino acid transport system permease protein